jgi:SAM-dependent methyltransferase
MQNVFGLYPDVAFHQLIIDLVAQYPDDQSIYTNLQHGLREIRTWAGPLTHDLPSLRKQKRVMGNQMRGFLTGRDSVDGYLEIGTTGRYVAEVRQLLEVRGDTWLCNDVAPGHNPVDWIERGQLSQLGPFQSLGNYDPLPDIPDASVDLVTNFIGFHHCPLDRLDEFLDGVRRVLRPGGLLLVREHDAVDDTMWQLVALAHAVFNAGVGVDWAGNQAEVREFRSVAHWYQRLEAHGFERVALRTAQPWDPTDNHVIAGVAV